MNQEEKPTWENTIEKIFKANKDNLLLGSVPLLMTKRLQIVQKYRNKVIYRYDLVKFRNDKYSKDIEIVRSDFSLQTESCKQSFLIITNSLLQQRARFS